MPQLGESVTEGTIGRWLKQPGDRVDRDEPLLEIETDKVSTEVPSPAEGFVREVLHMEGETVAVNSALAVIGDAPPDHAQKGVLAAPPQPATTSAPPPVAALPQTSAAPGQGQSLASPAVRALAEERGINLSSVAGSGLGGRITLGDVQAAPGSVVLAAPGAEPLRPGPARAPAPISDTPMDVRPLTPMRRAIAAHMAESHATIPNAWTAVEVDVTRLVALRTAHRDEWRRREGFDLTYLPFAVQAALAGLAAVPELNATWRPEGDGIVLHRQRHLGLAVSVEDGLVVPVLRNAGELSFNGLAAEAHGLIQRARDGKLTPANLTGATFTVNNAGALGSLMTQSIVPAGQAGILTLDGIIKRPVVLGDDGIAVRHMMNLCLTFDHRIIDGALALRFLGVVRQVLEKAEFSL
jgi:2-oxoisovalerate dehydrogenase E2 component (dihydrolipoyl transacylase)